MNWRGRKVLVTGACGFIGSHLAERLVELGAEVRALVQYNSFNSWGWLETVPKPVRRELEVVAGDVRDPHQMLAVGAGREYVFHLAALIAIPYSYHAPSSYIATNVTGTGNVLQGALAAGVEKFVQTSTSEVYGTARYVPIDEGHPLQGQSPYAASKIGADMLAASFHRSFGLPVAICRPFNTYGPRQSARAVIPTIITQLLGGTKTIALGSLHPTRDLTYVSDTVAGFLAVAASKKTVGETVNLGVGREISVGELAGRLMRLTGVAAKITTDRVRVRPKRSEVERLCSDPRRAKKLAGWKATVALDDGLARTIDWLRANGRGYKPEAYNL